MLGVFGGGGGRGDGERGAVTEMEEEVRDVREGSEYGGKGRVEEMKNVGDNEKVLG